MGEEAFARVLSRARGLYPRAVVFRVSSNPVNGSCGVYESVVKSTSTSSAVPPIPSAPMPSIWAMLPPWSISFAVSSWP
ncbi:hypothetical protein OG588_04770 [Streptomyces prunicolor]|uniref:hypothetical protein n=1 Tax=Streptomyces prunicolor TaxID=67348 RepID=UPI0038646242|nr:hypothetical protein OG588_04770 [Streptomyces prunicolor]